MIGKSADEERADGNQRGDLVGHNRLLALVAKQQVHRTWIGGEREREKEKKREREREREKERESNAL